MALSHPPLALHCPFSLISLPQTAPPILTWKTHQNAGRRNTILACSAERPSKKGRPSRAAKSSDELRDELREFISSAGLPADHVPSTKQLLEHGRKDLANVVRRRGHKVITELLKMSTETSTSEEKISLGDQETHSACKDADEVCINLDDSSLVESCLGQTNGSVVTDTVQFCEPSESSISSHHAKAASFIHTGVLDNIEDACELKNTGMLSEADQNPPELNTSSADAVSVACKQAPSCSMEQSQDRDDEDGLCKPLQSAQYYDVDFASDMVGERDNQIEIDQLKAMLHQKEMELSMLKQQIEKEKVYLVVVLFHDLEALSVMQATASAEIGKAHRNISAKDMELSATEQNLSGLVEVQIEYWANGETVEVAGSFNGWHHRLRMDLHSLSNTINPTGSRESKLWSTVLWLYPGKYEIKFIVDGHWKIDPQREKVNIGCVTNNVLRVDR